MCGLAGRFGVDGIPQAQGWGDAASRLLAHRGPDGEGHFRDEYCELVHRRLAIIDLSPTGHQPMCNEDGSIWVVYNGEIYNYAELRKDLLRRGHILRGTSDTEVLVHMYEDNPNDFVSRLRGIFAFALYDSKRRRLLLARDRFGIKPMFVTQRDNSWIFASELKALLAYPGVGKEIDHQACYDFAGLGYIPEPATGFADIWALQGGCTFSVSHDGHSFSRYHRVEAHPRREMSTEHALRQFESRVVDAVKAQSVADVTVASLLSGGIDSSLVTAAHTRAISGELQTFSVRFPDRSADESELAQHVAEHCGTKHHSVAAAEGGLTSDSILRLMRHFDQPFADTSFIPMYWVSEAVRSRGIVCALSGDGGDEAFGGYARFWRANTLYGLMNAPRWTRQLLIHAGDSLAGRTRNWGRQAAKAARLADAGIDDAAQIISGLSNYLSEGQKEAWIQSEARDGLLPSARLFRNGHPGAATNLEDLSRRLTESLFNVSLPSDMLRKVDMMSMLSSVEVRVPLLDDNIVSLGLSLPHRLKARHGSGKIVPRKLAREWLPPRIASHPKHGFDIPLDVMAPSSIHGVLSELLLAEDARTRLVFDRSLVAGWLNSFAQAANVRTNGYHANGNGNGTSGRSNGAEHAVNRTTGSVAAGGGEISRAGLYQRVMMALSLELWMRDHSLAW